MAISVNQIIMTVVVLLVMGTTLALGLVSVSVIGSQVVSLGGVNYTVSQVVDPTVLTLVTTFIPMMAIIGFALYFIPKMN